MRPLTPGDRQRPAARGGRPIRLDGQDWFLAEPTFRAGGTTLTDLDVDNLLDGFHERVILGQDVPLADLFQIARALLLANYEVTDSELGRLLEVDGEDEARELARAVSEALFGPDERVRGYTDWVRASLLLAGLSSVAVPATVLGDLMTLLVATGRTVPPRRFIDACQAVQDRESRESLI